MKTGSKTASEQWRMENLEQRFLDFREGAAQREAVLEARIDKLENKLGLPGLTNEEKNAALNLPSSDVHVFAGDSAAEADVALADPAQSGVEKVTKIKKVAAPTLKKQPVAGVEAPEAVAGEKPVVTAPASFVAKKQAEPVKPAAKKNAAAKASDPMAKYKRGVRLVNDGKHELGREVLEDFVAEYQSSSLQPNAVYWIGESFYSEKDYRLAIDLFREVLRKYPASNKAAAAMLKIGYSYERLNEISEARMHLLKVVEKYPHSNEARLARTMLETI